MEIKFTLHKNTTKMPLSIWSLTKHVNMAACMSENGSDRKLELYPFTAVPKCQNNSLRHNWTVFVSSDLLKLFQLLPACTAGFAQWKTCAAKWRSVNEWEIEVHVCQVFSLTLTKHQLSKGPFPIRERGNYRPAVSISWSWAQERRNH